MLKHLQHAIDALRPGATFTLQPQKEFAGPITLHQAVEIDGCGATVWALQGPVITIDADRVKLRNLRIEVTGDPLAVGSDADCALRIKPSCLLEMENVEVRGVIQGWPDEAGQWDYPHSLQLGSLRANTAHRFKLRLRVPVSCQITSQIAGVEIEPYNLKPGDNAVCLNIEGLAKDTLLHGVLLIKTALLRRRIGFNAFIRSGDSLDSPISAQTNQTNEPLLWEPTGASLPSDPLAIAPLSPTWAPEPTPVSQVPEPQLPVSAPKARPALLTTPPVMRRNQLPPQGCFSHSSDEIAPKQEEPISTKSNSPVALGSVFAVEESTTPTQAFSTTDKVLIDGQCGTSEARSSLPSSDFFDSASSTNPLEEPIFSAEKSLSSVERNAPVLSLGQRHPSTSQRKRSLPASNKTNLFDSQNLKNETQANE